VSVTAFWASPSESFEPEALVTSAAGNRWNRVGDPTVYLAGDPGLALIEAGRHHSGSAKSAVTGVVWSFDVEAAEVLDLRRDEVQVSLGLEASYWFLGRTACRELACALRKGHCSGVLTQSAGLPDVPQRWNLVLFVERLERPLHEIVRNPQRVGRYRLGPGDVAW
jgi:hypothetical protein